MKKLEISILLLFILSTFLIFSSCSEEKKEVPTGNAVSNDIANSPDRDSEIQKYNLEVQKKHAKERTPCDTISLMQYVLDNYPKGSYIVDFDKTFTYNIPRPAVLYYGDNSKYIFAVVALSKPGERLIEPKNIVGYDQSFVNLDSTKLGTAFFYLTLFECQNNNFSLVWEAPIPSHGGFNWLKLDYWKYDGTPFIKVDFHYAQGIGHIDYNYFLINGLTSEPHLLMTYKGINFQRTLANVNNDKYPDYYEYIYYDLGNRIYPKDSVAFIWNAEKKLYFNTRNSKQTRPY